MAFTPSRAGAEAGGTPRPLNVPAGAPAILADLLCPQCGYNLCGLTSDRCPECGKDFDRAKLAESRLPWPHRRWQGRVRAYYRTLRLVTLWPGELAREFSRPVAYRDCQSFRWVTVFFAWLPLGLSTTLYYVFGDEDCLMLESSGRISDPWLTIGFHLAAVLALAALTGVPSYFFHPRRLPIEYQNRGIALSYYAGAPLAWAPLAYAVSFTVQGVADSRMAGLYALIGMVTVQLLLWVRALSSLIARILREEARSIILPYFLVPLTALAASALTYFIIFTAVRFFGLMIFSLRGV